MQPAGDITASAGMHDKLVLLSRRSVVSHVDGDGHGTAAAGISHCYGAMYGDATAMATFHSAEHGEHWKRAQQLVERAALAANVENGKCLHGLNGIFTPRPARL